MHSRGDGQNAAFVDSVLLVRYAFSFSETKSFC
jgi:hypothetical protein